MSIQIKDLNYKKWLTPFFLLLFNNMTYPLWEPIVAGMVVSIINRMLFGNGINNCCQTTILEQVEHENSDMSSESSAVTEAIHTHAHI